MTAAHEALGARTWLVADGYLPSGEADGLSSHEAVCVLNTGSQDATLELVVYYEDDEPVGPIRQLVPARRTRHLRMDELSLPDGRALPRDVAYALVVHSDTPVSVQYSRMDVRSPSMALMTTLAQPVPDAWSTP